MRCLNCNEADHAPGAIYCHMCGYPLGKPAPTSMAGAGFRFGYADSFSEGKAKVESGGKMGFVNKTGNLVINPEYNKEGHYVFGQDTHWGFSEGLAAVSYGVYPNRQYGFIDHTGHFAILPQFSCAWHFSEGLAPIRQDGKWGYIDKAGKVVIQPKYDEVRSFSEGLALVKTRERGYEYIDKAGKPVIGRTRNLLYDPYGDSFLFHRGRFTSASDFHDGYAKVKCIHKNGFIDKTGLWVKMDFEAKSDFSEGLAVVMCGTHVQGLRYGYVDTGMNVVIEPMFEYATEFHGGFATVKMGGKWGAIDRAGDVVVPCQFNMVSPYHEGLAVVDVDGQIGYVDGAGAMVIAPQFDSGKGFSEGLAAVKKNNRWGFIDRTGTLLI